VPTYGNWGGPGWSGGEWNANPELTKWGVAPIDEMDRAFKGHDWVYQNLPEFRSRADRELVCELANLKTDSTYGELYRVCARAIFALRGLFWG